VDATPAAGGVVEQMLDVGAHCDVAAHGDRRRGERRSELVTCALIPDRQYDVSTRIRERLGQTSPDAACRAGDHHHLPGQIVHGSIVLPPSTINVATPTPLGSAAAARIASARSSTV